MRASSRIVLCAAAFAALSRSLPAQTAIHSAPIEIIHGKPFVMATVHPSSLLRADDDDREANIARFIGDLKAAAKILKKAHAHAA